jgi:hypothetical protein
MTKKILFTLAAISLAVCLISSIVYFLGYLSDGQFKLTFLLATIAWFVSATAYAKRGKKGAESIG